MYYETVTQGRLHIGCPSHAPQHLADDVLAVDSRVPRSSRCRFIVPAHLSSVGPCRLAGGGAQQGCAAGHARGHVNAFARRLLAGSRGGTAPSLAEKVEPEAGWASPVVRRRGRWPVRVRRAGVAGDRTAPRAMTVGGADSLAGCADAGDGHGAAFCGPGVVCTHRVLSVDRWDFSFAVSSLFDSGGAVLRQTTPGRAPSALAAASVRQRQRQRFRRTRRRAEPVPVACAHWRR